jgi:serine/threonine protein kinase
MPIRVCPKCSARFRDAATRCPHDGTALEERPDPLIGKVLGRRYRIVDEIGSGGMGTVFRARHVLVGRDVAVKLLSRNATRDPTGASGSSARRRPPTSSSTRTSSTSPTSATRAARSTS